MNAATARPAIPLRDAPGPPPHPLLGNFPEFRRDPLDFLVAAARDYGDVVGLWAGRRRAYLLCHPQQLQEVLQLRSNLYPKQVEAVDRLGMVLGRGLVTSSGSLWRRQRRVVQPAFHSHRLAELGPAMERLATDLVLRWQSSAARGALIDVHTEMMTLTFRMVGETLFGVDLTPVTRDVCEALALIEGQTSDRLYRPFGLPLWVPTRQNREFRAAVMALDRIVAGILASRRASAVRQPDLLSSLLAARDETGRPMSDRQLRDEVLTLLLAGHGNTGNALTWMWHLLATNPAVEGRLHAELDAVLGTRAPTMADLPRLPYARMVVEETLRLYPTSWLLLRRAAGEDVLGGYAIRPDSIVLISPFVTHRHPDFWPQPETFEPERFRPERVVARHRFAYLPFGAGARRCVGSAFALLASHLVLAAVAQRYRLATEPQARETVRAWPVVSLPPANGLRMTVHER
jgi:cytochrome P450